MVTKLDINKIKFNLILKNDIQKHNSGNRGKDFIPQFERRFQGDCNQEAPTQHCRVLHDNGNASSLSFRHSNVNLCSEQIMIDQRVQNFKKMFENRNDARTDRHHVNGHISQNGDGVAANKKEVDSSVGIKYCARTEIKWKEENSKTSEEHFTEDTKHSTPTTFTNSYESWYCPEEQQQIVDMLKEVNLRHDRQLQRDRLHSRGEQPSFSDESTLSNNDSQITERLQESSLSSDDEEDINILLYQSPPSHCPPIPETANEEELKRGYHEKSASDFFDEFQNIFTGSPEKKVINNMMKETMRNQLKEDDEESDIVGRVITDEDKNAVKAVLNFENMDKLTGEAFEDGSSTSSCTPKETFMEDVLTQDADPNSDNKDASIKVPLNPDIVFETKIKEASCKSNFKDCKTDDEFPKTLSSTNKSQQSYNVYSEEHNNTIIRNSSSTDSHTTLPKASHVNIDEKCKSSCTSRTPPHHLTNSMSNNIGNSNGSSKIPSKNKFKNKRDLLEKADSVLHSISKQYGKENLENHCTENHISHVLRDNKSDLETSVSTLNSKTCLQNDKPIQRRNTGLSLSEPFLRPRNLNEIYKKISLSEIFKFTDSNLENDFERFPKHKHCLNELINQKSTKIRDLSPSEHLKQILGIGAVCNSRKRTIDERNSLRHASEECSLNKNHFLDQRSFPPESFHKEKYEKVTKYPCCMPVIDAKKANVSEVQSKTPEEHLKNSRVYRKLSDDCANKNLGMTSIYSRRKVTLTDNNFANTNSKTENEIYSKGENCSGSFKTNEKQVIKDQNLKYKSEEKYTHKNKMKQTRSNLRTQNLIEETERKNNSQNDSCLNNGKRESVEESLKPVNNNKSFQRYKLHNLLDSEKSVNEDKSHLELCSLDKSKLESSKKKKRVKKNKKAKLGGDSDDKNTISNSTVCYDGRCNSTKNDNLTNFSDENPKSKCRNSYNVTRKKDSSLSKPTHKDDVTDFRVTNLDTYQAKKVDNSEKREEQSCKTSVEKANVKDENIEQKSKVNSTERREYSSEHKYSRTRYYNNFDYNKEYQYWGRSRYWKYRSGYSEMYKQVKISRETECDKELKNSNYFTQDFRANNKDILGKSKGCFQDNDIRKRDVQSVTNNDLGIPPPQENNTVQVQNQNVSKIVIPSSSELGEKCCSTGTSTMKNKAKKNNSSVISIYNINVLDSHLANPLYQIPMSKGICKTEHMLANTEIIENLKRKPQFDSLKEYLLKLADIRERYNGWGMLLHQNTAFKSTTRKKNNFQKSSMQERKESHNPDNYPEKLILFVLRKMNNPISSDAFKNHSSLDYNYKKSIDKHMRQSISKLLLNTASENLVFLIAPNIMDNYLRSKQASMLNTSFDVYMPVPVHDILRQFKSVCFPKDFQKALDLCLNTITETNLLPAIPQLLNLLLMLSVLHMPWTRHNLKEMLCFQYCNSEKNDVRSLEKINRENMNSILKCWDILFNVFTNRKLLGTPISAL